MSTRAELVAANRILYAQGVVDAFGHVSIRDEAAPDTFLLARNMAPGLVTEADIMRFTYAGTACDNDDRKPYLERFIHGSIYRARPEVGAIVHSHAPSLIPFGIVSDAVLRPVWHMSSFLGEGVPIFEIRAEAGDATDLLIASEATGDALARSIATGTTVLMRGHGATVVGANVREAVYRGVYLALNARLQADAIRLGPITYLSPGEMASATRTIGAQIDRAWNLWSAEAEA